MASPRRAGSSNQAGTSATAPPTVIQSPALDDLHESVVSSRVSGSRQAAGDFCPPDLSARARLLVSGCATWFNEGHNPKAHFRGAVAELTFHGQGRRLRRRDAG